MKFIIISVSVFEVYGSSFYFNILGVVHLMVAWIMGLGICLDLFILRVCMYIRCLYWCRVLCKSMNLLFSSILIWSIMKFVIINVSVAEIYESVFCFIIEYLLSNGCVNYRFRFLVISFYLMRFSSYWLISVKSDDMNLWNWCICLVYIGVAYLWKSMNLLLNSIWISSFMKFVIIIISVLRSTKSSFVSIFYVFSI